ncbi:MAG TPA: D-alanyl-D-alanine carboxypeptidase [Firmicutes bacterium]|nr:D-alanyl-D-alanine carboxypeptidase [Bacillota bacterium]
MRRLITVSIIIFVILWAVPAVAADELQIEAEGAVVIDGETGRVLWAKNPHLPLPPASTTKIMTSLLGLELGRPEEVVTVSQLAASQDGSRVYLGAGEEYTLRELLYAVQLASANDAAVAVAEHLAGSVEGFARLMNQRARELGAKNTNFINPNGLPDPEHRTSAYDLALITRKALQYPEYREMITTKCYPMSWPGHEEERQLRNRNKLLEIYEGADGVKTGYTIEADHTFVGSATREKRQLISVVLGSTNGGVWSDTVKLLDYGFENYSNHELVKAGEEVTVVPVKYGTEVPVHTAAGFIYTLAPGEQERISTEVNLPETLVAPLEAGAQLGNLTISLGAEKLAEIPLVAAREVRRKLYTRWWFWPVAIYIPWRIRVGIRRLQRHRRRRRWKVKKNKW